MPIHLCLGAARVKSYLRLLRFAAAYKWQLAAALACMLVLAVATAAYANLLGPVLEFLFTGRIEAMANFAKVLPRGWEVERWASMVDRGQVLRWLPWLVISVAVIKGIAWYGQYYLMGMTSQRVIADLRGELFDHMMRLSPGFYARRHSGDLLSRVNNDVQSVENAISNAVASYIRDGLQVVVMLASCFLLDWKLSLITFVAVPVTIVPIVRFARRLKKTTSQSQTALGKISEVVQEALSGIRVVQAYGMEAWESARFREENRRWLRYMRRTFSVRALTSPLMEVMAAVGLGLAIVWVGESIVQGTMPAAKFFSFVAAVLLLYTPVKQLGKVGQSAMQGAAAGERIFEVLDSRSEVPDDGRVVLDPFHEEIRFEDVSFSYGDRPVLRGVSLSIRKGEVVALVGSSGGGKTTLSNLLPRFWDVVGGRITIDGTDVRDATLASLRAQIALVTQETVLFNTSVRANIAYGRPEIPMADVERAARMAQAHDFIVALPNGYETVVGERGGLLSGGQRQRIAIARAFLRDAPILVLDEATSALDAESEREVQKALERLMGLDGGSTGGAHRTTLVIAHRLSTIRHADRIVVLSAGVVAEVGRHGDLLARSGEYARLYRIYEGGAAGSAQAG
ncbi:MAG TPA: ABC transporter transmembrane domain-containing protein [Anaeromyxobacteraceae bacterium]|nr:ABC transporter transmembrane domain-containing protein [Anaeromyxobacteraceae bacterium]